MFNEFNRMRDEYNEVKDEYNNVKNSRTINNYIDMRYATIHISNKYDHVDTIIGGHIPFGCGMDGELFNNFDVYEKYMDDPTPMVENVRHVYNNDEYKGIEKEVWERFYRANSYN